MKTRASNLFVALLVSLFGFALANAQEASGKSEPQFNASCRLSNGIHLAFANKTEPPEAIGAVRLAWRFLEADGNGVIHRVFLDAREGLFFGYDVRAEPVPNTSQIRIVVMPMSDEYEQRLRQRADFQTRNLHPDFKSSSIIQTQVAHLINDGDSLSVEVLFNQKTGVKIFEVIRASLFEEIPLGSVSANGGVSGIGSVSGKASEVFEREANLAEMKVINYRLLVNGELIAGDKPTGGCAGAILWFYLPGRGRFIFSTRPREGYDFQKIGVIENNKISFAIGGDQYQWISSSPVLRVNGTFDLWVLHDTDYLLDAGKGIQESVSTGISRGGLIIGAADKIKYILPSKK